MKKPSVSCGPAITSGRLFGLVLLTAASIAGVPKTGQSQQPQAPKAEAAAAAETYPVELFRLQYAPANEVQELLTQLLHGVSDTQVRIVADLRTNSLIVTAPPSTMASVRQFLESTDVPSKSSEQITRIFRLKNVPAEPDLANVLSLATRPRNVMFSVVPGKNVVVASGDEEGLQAVEELLQALEKTYDQQDAQSASPAGAIPADVQIRVVWLVGGLEDSEGTQLPPDDLSGVVKELARIGLTEPRLVAQTIVNAADIRRGFKATGSAKLDQPCRLDIKGMLVQEKSMLGTGDRWALDISISVRQQASADGGDETALQLCSLQSTISAPFGHSVVLGATPIGAVTSVFVVQIVPTP